MVTNYIFTSLFTTFNSIHNKRQCSHRLINFSHQLVSLWSLSWLPTLKPDLINNEVYRAVRWKRNVSPYAWTVMNLVDSWELCNYFIASFIPLIFCLFQLSTSYLLRHLDIRDLMAKCISKWLPQMYQWNTNSVWELFPCHLIVYIRMESYPLLIWSLLHTVYKNNDFIFILWYFPFMLPH